MIDTTITLSVLLFVAIILIGIQRYDCYYSRKLSDKYKALLHTGHEYCSETKRVKGRLLDESYKAPDDTEWRDLDDAIARLEFVKKLKHFNIPEPPIVEPQQIQPEIWK